MKRITQRWQNLTQKAAQFKQVVESVPPKVADIRDAIASTTGQIQQMRADVQNAVAGLQADTEERLLQSLREIDLAAPTFREAGFELTGVDMELGLNRRLLAHFDWVEDVAEQDVRAALTKCQGQRTVHAMLSALVQAGRLADRVDLAHMGCEALVVHVGPSPSVRVCWRTPLEDVEAAPAPVAPTKPASVQAPGAKSAFENSTYFEARTPAPIAATPSEPVLPPAATVPSPLPAAYAPPPAEPGDWKRNALDRFKRMPNLGPKPGK
jgi:hypothetical protein